VAYKRVVITEYGGPEVLHVVEEPSLPEPEPGEVRVRVLATSAAFTDTMIREGNYPGIKEKLPFSLGYDMVGEIDALGEGVTGLSVGQRVAELTVTGAYTEFLCLPAGRLVPVPEDLDPAEAVSLVLSYVTAYQMLHRLAKIRVGQRILIHGAGGAVGTAMLQLGGRLDLEMYGTASAPKHGLVEALGGIPIDYKREDFVTRVLEATDDGVDAAFDGIGGGYFKRSFRTLRQKGTLVAFGFYSPWTEGGGSVPLDFARLTLWNLLPNGRSTAFYSIASWRNKHPDWFRDDLTTLFDLLGRDRISPAIADRMPLTAAADAHARVDRAGVQGKIVLIPGID
jgi:NADPH2:quinone reductase